MSANIDRLAGKLGGLGAPADAIGIQHQHRLSGALKRARRIQAGEASAHHDDVEYATIAVALLMGAFPLTMISFLAAVRGRRTRLI